VEIRLRGTPQETRDTLAILATVLHIRSISRAYPGRTPSTSERVYLDAAPRANTDGAQ